MQQRTALDILTQVKPALMQQFGVVRLALFGSTARNEATENSDVDILVSFDGAATSARYFGSSGICVKRTTLNLNKLSIFCQI